MEPDAVQQVMFDMAWVSDPTAWLGLLTLVIVEIVLGIDNLVFIAILSAKLPPEKRDKARYVGLGGALMIRLLLLAFISYIVTMIKPLFHLGSFGVSGRDIVMFAGGIFLFYKATRELHSKLEGFDEELSVSRAAGQGFWMVVLQIMVLDAVFSLDAIITAVGMIDHVFIMMFAVIIAMGVMTLASRVITEFVSSHPTLVILCLGFLLLIGFSLLAEAVHFHIPKGYLYAAIGFSILIEFFNQIARRNTLNLGTQVNSMQSREVAANLVLRLLGSNQKQVQTLKEAIVSRTGSEVFNFEEKEMVSRVLQLSSLPVKAVMTVRTDVEMIDISRTSDEILEQVGSLSRSRLIAYKDGQKDRPLGYIKRIDILSEAIGQKKWDIASLIKEPLYLPESISILKALEEFRRQKKNIALVYDELGNFEGLICLHDILEEIAGELPEQAEVPELVRIRNGLWRIEGDAILKDVSRLTGFNVPVSERYHTIAGFILDYLQRVPSEREHISLPKWEIEILKADTTSIDAVLLTSLAKRDKSN